MRTSNRLERFFALAAVGLAVIAWFVGLSRSEADLEPYLKGVFPQAGHIEQIQGGVYEAWDNSDKDNLYPVRINSYRAKEKTN